MGIMRVLDPSGDVRIEWDPEDLVSTERAKAEFARIKEAGFECFKEEEGKKPQRIQRFSAKLEKILAVPGIRTEKDRKAIPGTAPRAMSGGPNTMLIC